MNRALFLLTLLSLALPAAAGAGIQQWTDLGPPGGSVQSLVIDPSDPSTVYAVQDFLVFRSTDGGATWTLRSDQLRSVLVSGLIVDPRTPSTLYASTFSGLYRSDDGAESWRLITTEERLVPAIDPQTSTLYAGAGVGELRRSTDGGTTWQSMETSLGFLRALAVDPRDSATVFASDASGLFRSTNHGETFSEVLDAPILTVVVAADSAVYAATRGKIYRSTNGGDDFTRVAEDLPEIFVLATAAGDPAVLAAGTERGLYRSPDRGATWSQALSPLASRAVAIHPGAAALLYTGTDGGGVYKTTDGGESWTPSSHGLPPAKIEALVRDPQAPSTLYAGSFGGGVYKTTDGGESWTPSFSGLPDGIVRALAIDHGSPSTLYAATDEGVAKSLDGASTWTPLERRIFATDLVIDPSDPSIVYAAAGDELLRTDDGGTSWSVVFDQGFPTRVAIHPQSPSTLYLATGQALWRSSDGAETWEQLDIGFSCSPRIDCILEPALAVDPVTPSTVYLAESFQVIRSLDGGDHWAPFKEGLERHPLSGDLGFAPAAPGGVPSVVLASSRGVFQRATPAGTAWRRLGDAVPAEGALVVIPGPPVRLYAGGFRGVQELELLRRSEVLKLHQGRFEVELEWRDPRQRTGTGKVAIVPGEHGESVALRSVDSAVVEFFGPRNWELLLKVLDGRAVNDRFWFFQAAATNVAFETTVTDTRCGTAKTYGNPPGVSAPAVTDTNAFPGCEAPEPPSCVPDTSRGILCLGEDGRFRAEVRWTDFQGQKGVGRLVGIPEAGYARSDDSGLFYFFGEDNWELLVKVLDGCSVNNHFWVFSAATTNVEYTLKVTDTAAGTVRTYANPQGVSAPARTDTSAFATCGLN